MKLSQILIILMISSFCGCFVPGNRDQSVIGSTYDKNKDVTAYFSIPEGNIEIPGKWKSGKFDGVSRSQYFYKNDTTKIAVGLANIRKYPFSNDSLIGFNFTKAFYEWDSKYYHDDMKLRTALIEEDSSSKYIIWSCELGDVENLFLLHTKGLTFHHYLFVNKIGKNRNEGISFLKELYIRNK